MIFNGILIKFSEFATHDGFHFHATAAIFIESIRLEILTVWGYQLKFTKGFAHLLETLILFVHTLAVAFAVQVPAYIAIISIYFGSVGSNNKPFAIVVHYLEDMCFM